MGLLFHLAGLFSPLLDVPSYPLRFVHDLLPILPFYFTPLDVFHRPLKNLRIQFTDLRAVAGFCHT